MAKKLDKVLVVDLESTCWKGAPPAGQESDIIEIGLCVLDARNLEVGESRGILVRPRRSQVSEFCTELTTLTAEQIEREGIAFADALKILRKDYDSRNLVFASYGDYDRRMVERQCRELEQPYPFGPTHLNVKSMLALAFGWPFEVGMAGALERLGLELKGTHHRGVDDAANIARLLCYMLQKTRA